jgi:hypothetical protein
MSVKMNDGFVPLDGSRHMQDEAMRHEAELAERCEEGHLSFAEVVEDYPFDNESAYIDFRLEAPIPVTGTFGLGGVECDLTGEANEAAFRGKILPPWYEYDLPRIGAKAITGPWYEHDAPSLLGRAA